MTQNHKYLPKFVEEDYRMKHFLFRLFRQQETKLHELNYLFWECTTRCNLHCIHCGSDCQHDSAHPDMPLDDFMKALDTIPATHRPKGFTVVLTGGEPLLRPDIAQIGLEIRRRGFGWSMVSNGYHYTPDTHRVLMGAGMGALTISLDGLEATHNWMRNNLHSFERAVQAITLAAREPRLHFDVVTCVNKRNITELEALYDFLSKIGVKDWRLFTIIPIGRAAGQPELFLDPSEIKRMMDFIVAKRHPQRPGLRVQYCCEGYMGPYEGKIRPSYYFCHAGINIAGVLIDGSINACPNIDRSFSQGSIYKDNFWDVWMERFLPFRERKTWTHKGICAHCRHYRNCLGNGMHTWHGNMEGPLVCHLHNALEI